MNMVKRVYTIVQGVVVVLAGMYGLFVTFGQYLNWNIAFLPKKDNLGPVILLGVSLLLIEVGFEHAIHFKGVTRLTGVKHMLSAEAF